MIKTSKLVLIILAVLFLSFLSASCSDGYNKIEASEKVTKVSFWEKLPDIVAVINGQEIYKEQLISDYKRMETLYKQADLNIENPEIQKFMKEMLIMDMVNTTLLIQQADKAEIQVDKEAVNHELSHIIAQFESEEKFKDMLTMLDMTGEEFEEKIRNQLRINEYLKNYVEKVIETDKSLDLTEEDKEKLYEFFDTQFGDMPDYEQMKPKVNQMLEQSKAQIIVGDLISQLLENSEIEIYIE